MSILEKLKTALFGDNTQESYCRPNEQILYFKDGQLYKIIGNQENWYDPKYIVSDGSRYDLSDPTEISRIPVPDFGVTDVLSGYGSTGMIDYVLRMKSAKCFDRQEKELCSALLWKSTELMFENQHCVWRSDDFRRLIVWHIQMGMDTEAEKARLYLENHGIFTFLPPKPPAPSLSAAKTKTTAKEPKSTKLHKMSFAEKERAIVEITNDKHMELLSGFPFVWNQKIEKETGPRTHPFCYMRITGENVAAVKAELKKLNDHIKKDIDRHNLKVSLSIPVDKLVFSESDGNGFTKFICTPITLTGKISKNPLSIHFTTPLYSYRSDIPTPLTNTTHGEVSYSKNGEIEKAKVYFWRNGKSWFFYYNTIDGELKLTKLD
ncbi:MAG: hypothetical protein J6Q92_05295 [Oscillospiraceae bacterium]|nr:hypothetical protein [Oscillospiraceae bacterium]